MHKINIYQMI